MIKIQGAIENGDYGKAEELFRKYLEKENVYNDMTAILDAAIGEYYGDRVRVWTAIRKGLLSNCRNYELYVMLGNYYLPENLYQSWLCYENALFYCDKSEDQSKIIQMLDQLKEDYNVIVNKTSIIILSYNSLEYTKLCIESIRMTIPEYVREIIVVDNASEDESVKWLREQDDIILIENKENKGFPAGCNQGIQASSPYTDIFLLNNDTILPENALFWLRMGLYDKEENGMTGSISNCARDQMAEGVENQKDLLLFAERTNVPMKYPYEKRLSLIGFALLIKRAVVDRVGLLDERFSPGNYEDNDYSLRVITAGFRNILCKNSFIVHFGNVSFRKNTTDLENILSINRQKINEKWGFNIDYYVYPRQELVQLIQETTEMPLRILDVGCGCGALMARVKGLYPKSEVWGIELVPEIAEIASHMGKILCGDVEKMELPWKKEYFDYVIMGDVLEHLMDPEIVLKRLQKYLKQGGAYYCQYAKYKTLFRDTAIVKMG